MLKTILFTLLSSLISLSLAAQCQSGNCKNGTGIFIYPSGAKYIGQFKDGEIHGVGTCYYTDNSSYRGNWVHRFPEGKGIKTYADGTTREGYWKKGQPVNANGTIIEQWASRGTNEDGTNIQSGCILGDCKNGEGTFAYADGSKYKGQFQSGHINGFGTFEYPDGDKFVGNFKKGHSHGKGTFYHADGSVTEGVWEEGEYMGDGRMAEKEGCLSGDCVNGFGTYVFSEGAAKYVGTFQNDMPNGQGEVFYANGEHYRGQWINGSFDGTGTLTLKDGTKVAGLWKKGVYAGKSTLASTATATSTPSTAPSSTPTPTPPPANPPVNNTIITAATTPAPIATPKTKVWAVVIGIADYDHMPSLRYTDDDAYRVYAFLKSPEGGALKDDQIKILIDEAANKESITKGMREVFSKAGKDDLVMLYFSGHGLKGSFLPSDFDGYNYKLLHEEINTILKESPAKYKLCIADACHSGSLLELKSGSTQSVLSTYYETLAQANPGTALIMSSKSDETSLESNKLRQGVFSHFLIRGLKGEADLDFDKVVSVQELYNFIDENVRIYTNNKQSPVIQGDYDRKMLVSIVR